MFEKPWLPEEMYCTFAYALYKSKSKSKYNLLRKSIYNHNDSFSWKHYNSKQHGSYHASSSNLLLVLNMYYKYVL